MVNIYNTFESIANVKKYCTYFAILKIGYWNTQLLLSPALPQLGNKISGFASHDLHFAAVSE